MMERPGSLAVQREIVVDAPVERVWRALTDPVELNRWQTRSAALDLRIGGVVEFDYGWGVRERGRVTELVPLERFSYEDEQGVITTWRVVEEGGRTGSRPRFEASPTTARRRAATWRAPASAMACSSATSRATSRRAAMNATPGGGAGRG